jgi:hypothetical protein
MTQRACRKETFPGRSDVCTSMTRIYPNLLTVENTFFCMPADEIALGMQVRYPRTGTMGSVVRIEQIRGDVFAELDSTHLLYRTDQLIPADRAKPAIRQTKQENAKDVIRREMDYVSGNELQESLKNIDQSCEGGG